MKSFEIIKNLCENNNTNITNLCKEVTGSSGNLSTWKNGNIRNDFLVKIAQYFNVTTDYLLGLSNEPSYKDSPISNLSDNDSDILEILHQFGERDQTKFIGKVEQLAKEYEKEVIERNFAKKEKFA